MQRSIKISTEASYFRDTIFAANDGIITTFAVVAGSAGALLSPRVVLILGFANLIADGFAMASGNYLAQKSGDEFEQARGDKSSLKDSPLKHALTTFVCFAFAGLLPLMPFVFGLSSEFRWSTVIVAFGLFIFGSLRGLFTKKSLFASGAEMFFIGGLAALAAYVTGFVVQAVG